MKKLKTKDVFLEHLKTFPIVLGACEKSGLSRNTIYQWRKKDPDFCVEMDEALAEGEDRINDLTENQLLTLIKEKNWSAIAFWLKHRNPKFKEKIEVTARVEDSGVLTPEQEVLLKNALLLALPKDNLNSENHDK
ncbi:MAG: phBC6A51 family helix-turn-helix protein [bacterium]